MSEGHCGNEPFALQVLGDSMAPEFEAGQIVIIDPEGVVSPGCYVLARLEEEYIFRQLVQEQEQYYLKPLNDAYPTLPLENLVKIHGVIVQRAGRRRHERKHYV